MQRHTLHLCCSLAFMLPAAAPLHAQSAGNGSLGPISSVSSEWLQLNDRSMNRNGSPSSATTIGHDLATGLRFELGYLRAARNESSAKGITGGLSIPLSYRRLTLRPGASVLVGQAQAVSDAGGYFYTSPATGQAAYQPRMQYSRGSTVGMIGTLGAELQIGAGVSATGSIREATFSGTVLAGNRSRTLSGFGLSVRPGTLLEALHLRSNSSASNPDTQR
jgi:hypothetical protein